MSGINYLLDTNAIIALLNGNKTIENAIDKADWLGISIINIIEFLSFESISANDKNVFDLFLQRVAIINLSYQINYTLINDSSLLRIRYKLKLPDAIIAASAISNDAVLVTNDTHFSNILNLQILSF